MMFLNMSMMMHEAAMQARNNSKEHRLLIEDFQLTPHNLYTIAEEQNNIDDNDVPYSDNNNDDSKNEGEQKNNKNYYKYGRYLL